MITLGRAAASWRPAVTHSFRLAATAKRLKTVQSPQVTIQSLLAKRDLAAAVQTFEATFDSDSQTLIEFCGGKVCDTRDLVATLMRVYTALGRMGDVRRLFAVALRDLSSEEVDTSPAVYRGLSVRQASTAAPRDHSSGSALKIDSELLSPRPAAPADAAAAVTAASRDGPAPVRWTQPSLLTASMFNLYLEVLTRRKNYDPDEVMFVLGEMRARDVAPDALTYHFLIELHIRAGVDPQPLWHEMVHEHKLVPLPATIHTLLLRVVPYSPDPVFVVEVAREGLRCGSTVMDKRTITELIEQWLGGASGSGSDIVASLGPTTTRYPPEYILWLMLELEVRCVLDKASFVHYVQKHHVALLLLQCARGADARTAEKTLALMERHMMSKTADVLALVVWTLAQALEVEKAVDLVELMARRGYLAATDPFRKFTVECLRYVMDKHFLMVLADCLSSAALISRALGHLSDRKRRGLAVSVDTLDVVVLAAGKVGEERQALHLVSAYEPTWGVRPGTNTLNCLLVGGSVHRGTALHRTVYEAMISAGVSPNALSFRTLIRQAVLSDSIDEAVYYLKEVSKHPALRVEVEMILPIIERAALAGDVDTANRISKFSLDCDVGIDAAVMQVVVRKLTEAGENVDVLKGHQKLHEALRSRSKAGRQRARSELAL